jgi:hypothetical protein
MDVIILSQLVVEVIYGMSLYLRSDVIAGSCAGSYGENILFSFHFIFWRGLQQVLVSDKRTVARAFR